jgi:hypothetical protein
MAKINEYCKICGGEAQTIFKETDGGYECVCSCKKCGAMYEEDIIWSKKTDDEFYNALRKDALMNISAKLWNRRNKRMTFSISKDKLRWIRHSAMYSSTTGKAYPHPDKVWKKRGMNHIIKAIPEVMGDCWMLLVKDWDGELEEYEDELTLTTDDDGYWSCFGLKIEE